MLANEGFVFGRNRGTCHDPIDFAVARRDHRHFSAAQACGGIDEAVEHRLHIEGRAADYLQDVAGRGLVFERFL